MDQYITIGLLSFVLLISGCGSGGALKSEFDAYQPPTYYAANTKSKSVKQPPEKTSNLKVDTELDQEFERLAQLKKHWGQSLQDIKSQRDYLGMEGKKWSKLHTIVQSGKALQAFLARGFSLQELEALTLQRNSGIKAAEKRFSAALEGFSQVAQLDEILRQYSAFTESVMNGVGPMKGRDLIQMKFPYPGITALKGQVVNQSVKIAKEDLAIARRDALTDIRRAFWNLTYVRQAEDIIRETLGLYEHLESVATTRYESGRTSYQDVVKVRIERAKLSERLKTLIESEQTVGALILSSLALPPQTPLGSFRSIKPSEVRPALEALYASALEHRQELRRIRAGIVKMELMIEMAETMILPAYSSSLSLYQDAAVNQVGSGAMKEPFATTIRAEVGSGLPKLPWFGSQDAYIREIRYKLESLRMTLRNAETGTEAKVRRAWFNLDQALREVALYRDTIVDLSQTSLDVSTRSYESGEVSFADVTASYTLWLNSRLALVRKSRDLGVAWAELEQATGIPIKGN